MLAEKEQSMMYQRIYPDVYYKVQPFVMMACDQMDADDYGMPSPELIRHTSDQIYMDVCGVHPDLAEREHYHEMSKEAASAYHMEERAVASQQFGSGGFFEDLITIMLLNEVFRRRRRY